MAWLTPVADLLPRAFAGLRQAFGGLLVACAREKPSVDALASHGKGKPSLGFSHGVPELFSVFGGLVAGFPGGSQLSGCSLFGFVVLSGGGLHLVSLEVI